MWLTRGSAEETKTILDSTYKALEEAQRVAKKTPGKWHPICSLIYTNRFIRKTKFRMTTTQMLKSWIRPGYFFILINLQDAYFTILLAKEACRFCRFTSKGTTFEYLCLMFGLGSSARVYAKLVKVVLTFLRI